MNDMTNTNNEGFNKSFYERLTLIRKIEVEEARLDKERLEMYEKLKTIKELKAYSAYFDTIKAVAKKGEEIRNLNALLKKSVQKDIDDLYHKKLGDNYQPFGTSKEFWIYETGTSELQGNKVIFFDSKIYLDEKEALDEILIGPESTYLIRVRRPIKGNVIEYGIFDKSRNSSTPYLQVRIF